METKRFKCKVCGYIHEGTEPPAECPVCKAPASEFEELKPEKKKGFSTNSNGYTLIYMIVIIVVVSLLLSITSGVLKGRQMDNVKLDKKKQILSSLPAIDFSADAAKAFEETITKYVILDAQGNIVKELDPVKDFDYTVAEAEYPMYVANVNGATKYILPMNGAGLWGALWGYIAIEEDRNTVYGVYFSHASETPGLGAEIVTPKFRDPFVGKHLLNAEGKFVSIAVMKTGQTADGQEQVDAISGGTITSNGVATMLSSSLGNYKTFLENAKQCAASPAAADVSAAGVADTAMVEPENIGE